MSQVLVTSTWTHASPSGNTTLIAAGNYAITDIELIVYAMNAAAAGLTQASLVLSSGGLNTIEQMIPFANAVGAGSFAVSNFQCNAARRSFASPLICAPALDLRLSSNGYINTSNIYGVCNISGFIYN